MCNRKRGELNNQILGVKGLNNVHHQQLILQAFKYSELNPFLIALYDILSYLYISS